MHWSVLQEDRVVTAIGTTCTEHSLKLGHVIVEICSRIGRRAQRQTNKQTGILITLLRSFAVCRVNSNEAKDYRVTRFHMLALICRYNPDWVPAFIYV